MADIYAFIITAIFLLHINDMICEYIVNLSKKRLMISINLDHYNFRKYILYKRYLYNLLELELQLRVVI